MQVWHCRVQREKIVEWQCRARAVQHQGLVAPQFPPIGVADRRHDCEAVETAAQNDRKEAWVPRFGGCGPRQVSVGEQRAGTEQ